jgi:hypothetical protein
VNKPQLGIHEYSSPNKGFSHCTKEEGIGEWSQGWVGGWHAYTTLYELWISVLSSSSSVWQPISTWWLHCYVLHIDTLPPTLIQAPMALCRQLGVTKSCGRRSVCCLASERLCQQLYASASHCRVH